MSRAEILARGVRLRNGVCCRLNTSWAEFLVRGCVDSRGTGRAQRTLTTVGVGDGSSHSGHSPGGHAGRGAVIVVFGNDGRVLD